MDDALVPAHDKSAPQWQPLNPIDRRVLGVLVEKAKTTPNAYPMSVSAICTAANQRSNRHPVMQLESDDVEESLERLRTLGAVGMIQGAGRVVKYRHYLYEWMGIDKLEMAVMAELLLRGAQTEGELRGRAARMEPITDLAALRPILNSLKSKTLVIPLSPEGRGHVVSHALYTARELESLKTQFASAGAAALAPTGEYPSHPANADPSYTTPPQPHRAETPPPTRESVDPLRRDLDDLRTQVLQLRADLDDLAAISEKSAEQIERLREELGAP